MPVISIASKLVLRLLCDRIRAVGVQVHLVAYKLVSDSGEQYLCFRFGPAANASKESERITVDSHVDKLVFEESPDLFELLVLGPGTDWTWSFYGVDIGEAALS